MIKHLKLAYVACALLSGSLIFFGTILFLLYKLSSLDQSDIKSSYISDSIYDNNPRDKIQINYKHRTEKNAYVKSLAFHEKASRAMAAKFRSLYARKIQMWYENHNGGLDQGHLDLGQETTTNTYAGHVFFFTEFDNKNHELARFVMNSHQALYIIPDSVNLPAPTKLKQQTQRELDFMEVYFNRTEILWRHYFGPNGPRPPPILFMWPADEIGQIHLVNSTEGYWSCKGVPSTCRSMQPASMEIEVISQQPRAFIITNFLSDFEADEIIHLARPSMHHSSVGDVEAGVFASDTRTSRNTWLPRHTSQITETLFRRAADVLQIDEKLLNRQTNAEDLQVVHYINGQKYDSHHDWGVSGYPHSRFVTLLLYLNNVEEGSGGETSFPKADHGYGIKVHPGKGNAVLFYNLLEDGNGDDLALHAALPILSGEKWLANFWVWDPHIKD